MKRPHVWVMQDLSNGQVYWRRRDGTRLRTYAWVHETRCRARSQRRVHQNNPKYSHLSSPVKMSRRVVNSIYAPIPDCVRPEYYQLRGSDGRW